jgi:ABC-type Zn uptake system ZnuABC Zn-binding protein ZnuA
MASGPHAHQVCRNVAVTDTVFKPKGFKIQLRRAFAAILLVLWNSGVQAAKLPVFVSILHQKYFVQQIGKELVGAQVMVRPGASPCTYEPKPRQMAD